MSKPTSRKRGPGKFGKWIAQDVWFKHVYCGEWVHSRLFISADGKQKRLALYEVDSPPSFIVLIPCEFQGSSAV